MGKTALIYKSKYGTTKTYAEWVAAAVGADLLEAFSVKPGSLLVYDTIILGGGLYAGGILGASVITKNFESIKDKKIAVFTVGLADPIDPSIYKPIIEKNFPSTMRDKIKFFHFRGGTDYKKLGFLHKLMMSMLKKLIDKKKPEELTDENKRFLETYGQSVDFTDKKYIEPLCEYVK